MNFENLKKHSSENLGNGTNLNEIENLEEAWGIKIPSEFRQFLIEIGYAEIFGDEIYSVYEVPDETPCAGLHWMNKDNENLQHGFIKFFSNDIEGEFYINSNNGKVYLNSTKMEFAESFISFANKMISE